eukprot:Skav205414  [mRNA]  locus=scaffold582:22279:23553:- [translate_table: standard]
MGSRRGWLAAMAGSLMCFLFVSSEPQLTLTASKSAAPWISSRKERQFRRVQGRYHRLHGILKRIVRPRLEFVEIDGRKRKLPLRAEDADVEDCSDDELAYLSGFFDGDGCVSLDKRGQFSLRVGQAVQGLDVLVRFRQCFGGGIYRQTDGCGFQNPVVQWVIKGVAMQRAAMLLAKHSCTLQSQLYFALNAKTIKEDLPQTQSQWADLKAENQILRKCTLIWPYVSGFFDAEGCVQAKATQNSICLEIEQKQASILHMLIFFFEEQGVDSWKFYGGKRKFRIMSSKLCLNKKTLRHFLCNQLILKRDQARLALQVSPSNHCEIRKALSQLVGQQSRYRRLGKEGDERAKEIKRQQSRISRCHDEAKLEVLRTDLQQLQEDHRLQNLQHTCSVMKSDIRRLLSEEGCHLRPLEHAKRGSSQVFGS